MPDTILNITQTLTLSLIPGVYATDLIDIIIIATLIYLAFLLLRQTRSLFILFGIFLLAGLYLLAKIFDLYLTTIALQTVFSFVFIIIIVVFQNEIRRFFELLGLLGTRQIKFNPGSVTNISEVLANVCDQAAKEKTGVLIILNRKDDISNYSTGGQLCDSIISEELLESIFDPNSSGHDGAVIIKSNRLFKFGVHLPLSTNFKEIGKHGTRHSAALGISEVSDAIAIVVSEEKGTISIAVDGKLKTLSGAGDLLTYLQKNLQSRPILTKKSIVKKIITQHLSLKVFSLFAAVGVWIVFAYRAVPVQKTFEIPVSFENLPDGLQIQDFTPKDISLTLESRNPDGLNSITQQNIQLKLDTNELKTGLNSLNIKPSDVEKPLNIDLVEINPPTIYLTALKYSLHDVQIKVNTTGSPLRGFTVQSVSATPQSVQVWIPEGEPVPDQILTEPVNIVSARENILAETKLVLPKNIRLQKPDQSQISIAVVISEN